MRSTRDSLPVDTSHLTFSSHTKLDAETKAAIVAVAAASLQHEWNQKGFEERLERFPDFHLTLARVKETGKPAAFKIGYARTVDEFYSWLGAVHPSFQRSGLGSALMRIQHEWAKGQGYRTIQTKCYNTNEAMIRLNMKHEFLVIDTEPTEYGLKLILEKSLFS